MTTLEIPLESFVKFEYVLLPILWDGDSVRFAPSFNKITHQNYVAEAFV